MFNSFSAADIFLLSVYLTALFFLVYGLIFLLTKLLNFSAEDQTTAVFCGSKKSLVHGSVMSKILFPDANIAGIILLPLMLYHALQLIAASILAQAIARKNKLKVEE